MESPAGLVDYDYDDLDRLWRIRSGTRVTTVEWEAGGERVLSTGDAASRLARATVTRAVAGGGVSSETFAFAYDHAGRRIRKSGPSGDTRYLWGAGACTGPSRSLIPEQADHGFRSKPITDSGASRSLNA